MSTASRRQRGFTLTEILIVLSIIVLVLAMAVPAFNFITGNRSLQAAQNQVSAVLGRARSLALYHNRTIGVGFYRDQTTDRVAAALVEYQLPTGGALEFVPDQDPQLLQPGTSIKGMPATGSNGLLPTVVLFDGQGRLCLDNWSFTFPGDSAATNSYGQVVLVLHDRQGYDNAATPPNQSAFLVSDGLFLTINRYNGTFLRNE